MAELLVSKVGRLASEEVVISLLRAKRLPVLLYGVEACPVLVSIVRIHYHSLTYEIISY